ncbi:MAG: hypothetical protein QGH20_05305, partial [Candidatus Latescibacteria bacterium]|nr:hypothetical protein [Candidatus Latescibacterota bacterium]
EGFITAGLPVLIDKPIVGSVAEAQRLLTLCNDHNARITGGSSLRFAKEIIELKDRGDDLGEVVTAYASGPGDFFSYGIHTHEMAAGVLGSGAKSVSYLGENRGVELFQVDYRSGAVLMMELHAPVHTWHFTATTTTGVHHTPIDASTLYQGLLDQFVALIEGQTPRATVDDLIESVLVMIAAQKSRRYRTAIFLEDLEMEDGFDGGVYTEEYRRLKYPDGWT